MQNCSVLPRLPRSVAVVLWVLASGAAHVALPITLARRGRHLGWKGGCPRTPNLGGVLLVGAGTAGLAWSLAQHYHRAADDSYKLSLIPEYLLRSGPTDTAGTPCISPSF
jgi:hypothetical protein